MPDAFPPTRRLLHASLVLLLPFAGKPALAVPVDVHASNIASADTRSAVSPVLPVPAVALSAPPITFLQAARQALAARRTGEAQEALERAETRLLESVAQPGMPAAPALVDTRAARLALGANDRVGAAREIDAAIATLRPPAVAVAFPPPVVLSAPSRQPAPVAIAAVPPETSLVTKALLPGRWELRGAKYVWVPPDTELRLVDERAWLQGRNVWRSGAWVWVPAHYGFP
jgi:hypothetical protein